MNVSKRTRHAVLAAVLVAGIGGVALAQGVATGVYDPAQLPSIQGRVAQYSLSPRGDVDGLILESGTEVHLPPHLGTQLVFAVKPGDSVTIHGLKARSVDMVQAMQVTNDASGKSVTDGGPTRAAPGPDGARPPRPPAAGTALEAQGVVKSQLHGPQGDLNGVLLADGTIIRLPPPEAAQREAALAVGKTVFARGNGSESALGRVIDARELGTSAQDAAALPVAMAGGPRGPGAPPPPAGNAPSPAPAAPAPTAAAPTAPTTPPAAR